MTENKNNKRIILASASPRRAEIFRKHGASFKVLPSGADETIPIPLTPQQTVMYLSLLKARDVYEKLILEKTSCLSFFLSPISHKLFGRTPAIVCRKNIAVQRLNVSLAYYLSVHSYI